jgi:hypothetical protein
MGSLIRRDQLLAPDRPTLARHPWPRLEVDRIQRTAPTKPAIGASAEEPASAFVEPRIGQPDVFARIKVLRFLIARESAAFEQHYVMPRTDELQRDRYSRRPSSDHAKIGGQALLLNHPGIEKQLLPAVLHTTKAHSKAHDLIRDARKSFYGYVK